MLEPNLVTEPVFAPSRCIACGSITGPMVDLMVELDVYGRVYLCVQNCVSACGRLAGHGSPEAMSKLTDIVGKYEQKVHDLEQALSEKTVSLTVSEVEQLLGRSA